MVQAAKATQGDTFRRWTGVVAIVVAAVTLVCANIAVAPAVAADFVGVPVFSSGTSDAGGRVTLQWTAATYGRPVVSFNVYRTGQLVANVAAVAGANQWTSPALPTGKYWFNVQGVDATGLTSAKTASALVPVWAGDGVKPSAVTGLRSSPNAANRPALSWDQGRDNLLFDHYETYDNGIQITADERRNADVDYHLARGRHWIQVAAVDRAGNRSVLSPPVLVDYRPPWAPHDLTVTATTPAGLTLAWTPPTPPTYVDHYDVYQGDITSSTLLSTSATSIDIAFPYPGVYVTWVVVAVDAFGYHSVPTPPVHVIIPDT